MKTLVIGGDGLLGSYWMKIFKKIHPDDSIVGTTRRRNSASQNIYLELSESSLKSVDHFLREIGPQNVIYLAGITNVEECESHQNLALDLNARFPGLIAAACHRLGMKFLYISTDHMFDNEGKMFAETARPSPVNHYAYTKKLAEELVAQSCPTALIVRTNFYGKSISDKPSFTDWIRTNLTNKVEMQFADDIYFNPVFMGDLVLVSDRLLQMDQSGIFNVTSDERISKYEFAIKFADFFKLDSRWIKSYKEKDHPRKVRRPLEMSLSNEKVKRVTEYNIGNMQTGFHRLQKETEGALI